MVKTRSQMEAESADAEQRGAAPNVQLADTPRSPSEQPAEPRRIPVERHRSPAAPQELATGTTTVPQRTAVRREQSPAASRRSSTGSAARRRAQLQLEAQERLLDISRRELRLEAEMVKKRLALEMEALDIEERSSNASGVHERVNQWLEQANRQANGTSCPPATTPARQEAVTSDMPPPHLELRGEPLATPRVNVNRELPTNRPNEARRPRSPTPNRTSRGLEQLAQVIEKMARNRPPPRQAYELPTFSGAPNEWLPFKAAMRDTTRLYHLSPVENLARLRTCLRGEARDTVAALLHTATSPDEIMNTLEQCYGRPEMIVDRALEDLRRLPRLGTNANELNNFAIKVQNIVTVLQNVDRKGYLHNPLLVREILEKLSPHLRSRWCDFAYEHRATSAQEVVTLSHFLMREANFAVRFAYLSTAGTSAHPAAAAKQGTKNQGAAGPTRNRTRGAAAYTAAEEREQKPRPEEQNKRLCPSCGGEHKVGTCRKLRDMTVSAR